MALIAGPGSRSEGPLRFSEAVPQCPATVEFPVPSRSPSPSEGSEKRRKRPRSSSAPATLVVRRPRMTPCDPSDRLSRQLVSQTIGFLERAKAIEDREGLLERRRGLHFAARELLGATQCP